MWNHLSEWLNKPAHNITYRDLNGLKIAYCDGIMPNLWVSRGSEVIKMQEQKVKVCVTSFMLQSSCGLPLLTCIFNGQKVICSPNPKASFVASSISILLTRRLKKVSMRWICSTISSQIKKRKKKSIHAGCYNARASIRRERWQNETLCTFEPWNYRLVSPRQSPGVTDAIRACLDKRSGVHQNSLLSITAQVSRIKTT